MKPQAAQNERDRLAEEVRHLRWQSKLLTALGILLACGLVWTGLHSRVMVVPPEVRRPYEVGAGYGNVDYLSDMSDYVMQLLYTNTPDSVDHHHGVLLKMTDPDSYGSMKAQLDAAALRSKALKVSSVWTASKSDVYSRDLRVRISGRMKTYIADVPTSNGAKQFLVEFSINSSGRLNVLNVQEVVKADPARPAGK